MPETVFGSVKELKESQCVSVSLAQSSLKLSFFHQIFKLFSSLSTPSAISQHSLKLILHWKTKPKILCLVYYYLIIKV